MCAHRIFMHATHRQKKNTAHTDNKRRGTQEKKNCQSKVAKNKRPIWLHCERFMKV